MPTNVSSATTVGGCRNLLIVDSEPDTLNLPAQDDARRGQSGFTQKLFYPERVSLFSERPLTPPSWFSQAKTNQKYASWCKTANNPRGIVCALGQRKSAERIKKSADGCHVLPELALLIRGKGWFCPVPALRYQSLCFVSVSAQLQLIPKP